MTKRNDTDEPFRGTWVLRGGIRVPVAPNGRRLPNRRDNADRFRVLLAERYADQAWFANPGMCEPARDTVNGWARLHEALADAENVRGWESQWFTGGAA